MMRKVLYGSVAAMVALAITSGLYLKDQKQYDVRAIEENEPYAMEWARIDLRTGEYNPAAALEAKSMIMNNASRNERIGLEFMQRGPDNVGGRTRAIIELYGKPDTLITGGVSGGLWMSYDAGATWQPHAQFNNQDSSSAIISCIHQDTNTGRIYVGTGSSFDAFANSVAIRWPGFGIYYSDDEGETFKHMTSTTPDNRFSIAGNANNPWIAVNRIRTNAQGHIFAATHRGLLVSEDEGETWNNYVYIDDNNSINFANDACADVVVTRHSPQKVLVSFAGGRVYLSEDGGSDGSFTQINDRGLLGAGVRTCVAVSESDPDVMYVLFNINPLACLGGIYKSIDGGETFNLLLQPHDNFEPMGNENRCQGVFDVALCVDPKDPETIFIGGVEIWRYDGSLTRVASEGGGPPASDVLPFYVHADKHYFYYSPNDKRTLYVTTDGGVTKSVNNGQTWQGINKNYVTTQFYGISHFNGGGTIIGGTQDNGTLAVLGENSNDPLVGYQVTGNDGIDCDASQFMPIAFTSSQNGMVFRADLSGGSASEPPVALVSSMNSGGPFLTVVKLWESINDPTSKDSILFEVTTTDIAIATGNGILRTFNEEVSPVQAAASIVESSVVIQSGTQVITVDPSDGESLIGDGEGSVSFNEDNSITINVTFDQAPAENANITVFFDVEYSANDVLILESENLRSLQGSYTFEHRLESNLGPGDVVKIQDPVQSILLSTGDDIAGGSIRMYRNVLNAQQTMPAGIGIPGVGGSVTCMEFTNDGNTAFVGSTNGSVYRITGFNNVYTEEDANANLTSVNILQGLAGWQGPVTGVAIDRTNNDRVIVTGGGYGNTNRIAYVQNALSNPSPSNVHGNLAPMPIYDAEFNLNDPNMVLVGTDFGLWATADITASAVTWSDENDALTYIPIYDIRQQWLPFEVASNSGVMYVGTHGRGLWQSNSEELVSVPEFVETPAAEKAIADFSLFPNPVQGEANIRFDASFNGTANVTIYDMNGRSVQRFQKRVVNGSNNFSFFSNGLRTGAYFAVIEAEGMRETTKFMVMR